MLQGGQSFDIYAIDIYYHRNCYLKYAVNKLLSAEEEEELFKNEKEADVRREFRRSIRFKIVRKKEAFLLHQLLADFKAICEDNDIEPFIEHTVVL